jgi:hypothetical protein
MDSFFEFLDGLNKYSSLVLMFATLVYVYFTYKLTKETTKLREVETSPFINAYIDIKQGISKIVISNIGKTPAYNLNIEFEEEKLKEIRRDIFGNSVGLHKAKIKYFGVGQKISFPFMTEKLYDKEIILVLNYKSKDNHNFEERIFLSLKPDKEMNASYHKNPYHDELTKIKDELKGIGQNIKKLTQYDNTEKTYTIEDLKEALESKKN